MLNVSIDKKERFSPYISMTSSVKIKSRNETAIVITNWQGNIKFADEEAVEILGSNLSSLVDSPFFNHLDKVYPQLQHKLQEGEYKNFTSEVQIRRNSYHLKLFSLGRKQDLTCILSPKIEETPENHVLKVIENLIPGMFFIEVYDDTLDIVSGNLSKMLGYADQSEVNYELKRQQVQFNRLVESNSIQVIKLTDAENYKRVFKAHAIRISQHRLLLLLIEANNQSNLSGQLEKSREQLQKQEIAQEKFLSELSHEFRSPLNAILGLLHVLRGTDLDQEQEKVINNLHFASNQLLNLVNGVLDISKIKFGELDFNEDEVDLPLLITNIKHTFDQLAHDKGLSIVLEISKEVPGLVKLDETRLIQVLTNLLSNAIKFTEDGQITIRIAMDHQLLVFKVIDTGIGIPTELQQEIFQSFKQADKSISRRYGGTGLGLAIIKKLIDMQGGEISVKSELGKGSEFQVSLPFTEVTAAKTAESKFVFSEPYRALYAEDVASNLFLMESLIKMWGGKFDSASTAAEAFKKYKENQYDILLIDINLPDENGYHLIQRIRELNPVIPVIVVSGEMSSKNKLKLRRLNIQAQLSKPIDPEKLRKKIQDVIKRNEQAESNSPGQIRINFDFLDKLYTSKNREYANLLRLMAIEYEKYFEALSYAIKNSDSRGLRSIHHKLKANMKSLDLFILDDYLNQIKAQIRTSSLESEQDVIVNLKHIFHQIIRGLQKKQTSLESEES